LQHTVYYISGSDTRYFIMDYNFVIFISYEGIDYLDFLTPSMFCRYSLMAVTYRSITSSSIAVPGFSDPLVRFITTQGSVDPEKSNSCPDRSCPMITYSPRKLQNNQINICALCSVLLGCNTNTKYDII